MSANPFLFGDVSLATAAMMRRAHDRLRPAIEAEHALDAASGVPLLGDPAHWTHPVGSGTAEEPFEACDWRRARDPHCRCFRCDRQPEAIYCARALVAACPRPECYWCDSVHHVEGFARGARKAAKATGLPLVSRPAPEVAAARESTPEATLLRAALRDKAPDGAVALAFTWRLCLAVEPCEGGCLYRRICMTKHDRCGVVHPSLDAALAVYRDDLARERGELGRVVTERAEGESIDALVERHAAALAIAGGRRG